MEFPSNKVVFYAIAINYSGDLYSMSLDPQTGSCSCLSCGTAVMVYQCSGAFTDKITFQQDDSSPKDIILNKLIILSDVCAGKALRFFGPTET